MQKKLIALAVAGMIAAPAFAQSNVTVYGRIDYGYLSADTDTTDAAGVKGSTETTSTGFGTGALTTSRLGVMGSEDLGNGLKANFNLELAIASSTTYGANTLSTAGVRTSNSGNDLSNSFTTRLANVGLSGSFGAVTLGRQTTAVETAWLVGSAGGVNNATGSIYQSGIKQNNTRSSELVTYTSPDMSGFKASVQYGKGETDVSGNATGSDLSQKEVGFVVTYGNGPLNVALGYSKEKGEHAGVEYADPRQVVLSGNYDFGAAKVFGTYAHGSNDEGGLDKAKAWELGVNVPVGMATTLIASYYDGSAEETAAAGGAEADIKGYQLGAVYSLSKRTKLYALYGNKEADVQKSVESSETTNFALGVRHDF